jgi:hypothetical protein
MTGLRLLLRIMLRRRRGCQVWMTVKTGPPGAFLQKRGPNAPDRAYGCGENGSWPAADAWGTLYRLLAF